ncbi:MAG: oligosaccharide flippase family protein [Lachnospiraceae bacterium]|nr:oligosaccharide flippase family protein [Lachnospiraceae bacterium]
MRPISSSGKSIFKNLVMLYGLSIAKIVFPLITLPYFTRVLSTDTYGAVAYVKSTMQYMQLAIDFGFMLSGTKDIVKVRENMEAVGRITSDILGARILLGVISANILLVISIIIPLLRANFLYSLLSFIPVFLSIFLFDYLFRGIERMEIITIRFVIMRGISTLLTFFLVKKDADILWIPVLDILGSVLAVILVIKQVRNLGIAISMPRWREALAKLKESTTYFVSNMATTAFGAFNTMLVGIILPASDVAYWSVSMQLIGAVQTLYSPITDGVYPEMVKTKKLKYIKTILTIFMPIIVVGCVFSILMAKPILVIVGGRQYSGATAVFRMLVPVLFFCFPAMLLGWPTLGAIEKAKEVTKTTLITAIIQVAGLGVLAITGNFTLVHIAILRVATEFLLFLTRVYYTMKFRRCFNYNYM